MRKTRGRKSEPESSEEETEVELEEEEVERWGNKLKRKVKGKGKLAFKRPKKATNSNRKLIKEEYVHESENDDEEDGNDEDEPVNVKGKGKKLQKPRCAYKLRGFPYAFQVWACEILLDLEETKIVMLNRTPGVARLFHWKMRAGGSFFKLQSHVFNSQKVQLRQLVPMDEEKKAPYWAWALTHDIGVPDAPENDRGHAYAVHLEPILNDVYNGTSVHGNPNSPEWEKLVMMLMERVTTLTQENAALQKKVVLMEIHQGKVINSRTM